MKTAISDPKDFDGRPHALEVLVTRDQDCLPGLGEGGGEAVGVGKIVLSFEAGGQFGQVHVHIENLDGKLSDRLQLGGGGLLSVRAPDRSNRLRPS